MDVKTDAYQLRPVSFGQYVQIAAEEFKRETGIGGKVDFYIQPAEQVSIFNPTVKMLTVAFKATLWQQELKRETFKTPADWWEHFKERWFGYRMKRWFPVKYEEFDIVLNAVYPYKKLAFPDSRVIYRYEKEVKNDETQTD